MYHAWKLLLLAFPMPVQKRQKVCLMSQWVLMTVYKFVSLWVKMLNMFSPVLKKYNKNYFALYCDEGLAISKN